jgi:hypothetical protein
MKRKTIGETPWDAVVPPKETSAAAPPKKGTNVSVKKTRTTPASPTRTVRKERLTVHLSVDVIERAKNAVFWTPGLTLARMAEEALQKALEGLEKAHGGPFAHRKAELKGGRPMK